MATCPPYQCYDSWEDLLDDSLCLTRQVGGISSAIVLKCDVLKADVVTDADDEVLDEAKIAQLLLDDRAKLITGIQVTINEPSPLNAPSGDPCKGESPVNYDRSLTWTDINVNRARQRFYNSINAVKGFPIGGLLLKHCADEMVTGIFADVSLSGGRTSPEQSAEIQQFAFNITYRSVDDDQIFEGVDTTQIFSNS